MYYTPDSRPLQWLRAYPYTLFGIVLFLGMLVPFVRRGVSEWDDVYVRAALHLRAGEGLYDPRDGYAYPPFMALLAVPFSILPQPISRAVFFGVNALSLVILCRSAWFLAGGRRLEGGVFVPWREHVICLLGLLCAFRFSLDAVAHQQTDLVIGALLLGGCHALYRERVWLAATCLGLAAAMKCTPLLWLLYLAWQRRWLPALWLIAVAAGVNLLPDLVSTSPNSGWWLLDWMRDCVLPKQGAGQYPGSWHSAIIYNQSLAGLVQRWLVLDWSGDLHGVLAAGAPSPRAVKWMTMAGNLTLLILVGGVFWQTQRKPKEFPLRSAVEYGVVLLLMLLFSPMSSKPHFCTLLLPAFCLARLAVVHGHRLSYAILTAAVVAAIVSTRGLVGVQISSYMLWCGMVTWSALFLLLGCLLALAAVPTMASPPGGNSQGTGTATTRVVAFSVTNRKERLAVRTTTFDSSKG